ncbi:alcohol dehydrogenase catalytic domain-containing protein [Azospirillum sp. ST 5-10]|uniref:alcohol dehydrogenase catalytic domain-containing protein n=1 Tax=unclassified Azospirillum TaxID=2630922 RepID=UPI003F4A36C0
MRALLYTGPRRMDLTEVDDVAPAAGEVAVRVEAVGICGSDMHAWLGHDERRPAPLVLGHEAAGTVLGGALAGRRVAVNPLVTCMACPACLAGRTNLCPDRQIISMPPRPGAFAERIALPERNLIPLPDGFDAAAAALAEPLACGWHAVRLAGRALDRPLPAARCLVIGGGAIGLSAALALAAFGAAGIRMAEPNRRRHAALAAAGPFAVFDPADGGPGGGGPVDGAADLVVDAYGGEASRAAACRAAAPGGVIVHIGLAAPAGGLDVRRMTLQELTVVGAYTYTAADFRDTVAAMLTGRLGALDWSERRSLADGPAAFRDLHAGGVAAPKLVLVP